MSAIVRGCYPENDGEFEEQQITGVTVGNDRIEIGFRDSMFTSVEPGPITPVVGMTVRFYGKGFGYPIRGVFIDSVCFRYSTPTQKEWEHRLWCAQKNADDAATAEREIPKRDVRWAKLPAPLRERKERFMRNNSDWRRDYEEYELFTCEEAAKIATAFKTAAEVQEFAGLSWKDQKARIPDLGEGHSGNTFGMACRLAMVLLEHGDLATDVHGALSPLVGSDAYGDVGPE